MARVPHARPTHARPTHVAEQVDGKASDSSKVAEMKQVFGQNQLTVPARDAMERGFCRPRALRSRRSTPSSILPVIRKGNFAIISKTPWAELVRHTVEIPLQVQSPSLGRQIALYSHPNQVQCTNIYAIHTIDICVGSLRSKMCRNFIQHSVASLISSICKFVIFAVHGRPKKISIERVGRAAQDRAPGNLIHWGSPWACPFV